MCSPRPWSNASHTAPSSRNLQSCELGPLWSLFPLPPTPPMLRIRYRLGGKGFPPRSDQKCCEPSSFSTGLTPHYWFWHASARANLHPTTGGNCVSLYPGCLWIGPIKPARERPCTADSGQYHPPSCVIKQSHPVCFSNTRRYRFHLLQGWLSSGPMKPACRASSLDEGSGHLIGEGLHNVPDLVYLDLM
jgi:hypothetical protein